MNPAECLPGPDWYPVELDSAAGTVSWIHLPGERFSEAFFEDTLRKHGRQAKRKTTSLAMLDTAVRGGCDPAAFFFHSSRCGSTLVMQLLGRVPGCRALSEPPVLDQFLQDPAVKDCQLRGLIHALGRSPGNADRTFLKTDSWHLPHLERIRRIFPGTPCFFLYREPAAILRSHQRERGMQMVPGILDPKLFGLDPATMNHADLDGHAERVLTTIFSLAVQAAETGKVIPVAHSQLPHLLWEQLGPFLGLPKNHWDLAKERSLYDAKHIQRLHHAADPTLSKPHVPPALVRDFERLEALRETAQSRLFSGADPAPSTAAPTLAY